MHAPRDQDHYEGGQPAARDASHGQPWGGDRRGDGHGWRHAHPAQEGGG